MTGDQLIDEGRRLARPCVYLRSTGEHLAGIWGGDGIIPCGDGPYRHWLSIGTQYIPDGRSKSPGCLSIYTNEDDCTTGIVAVDAERILPEASEGLRLYAHPDSSLPPLEAVFKFGSSEVRRWLTSNNWEPEWGYNDNFPDRTATGIYERKYQRQLPLFSGDAYAVLGGWHMPWPEGDWDEMVEKQLIVWTFADSEPWVEAWRDDNNYNVIQRIT
ncbi:hypothetical protein AB1L88_02115 [Tautonia sp. JC769]|uniref:hypothetical protein n=1 Tax=Tautonia sp. JC769 TaxID=3232135 RepID=UPI00345A46CB